MCSVTSEKLSLVLSKRCDIFLMNHNKVGFAKFVHVFKGTAVSKFMPAALGQSIHDRYNCIVYTDDDNNNYFLSYSDLTL